MHSIHIVLTQTRMIFYFNHEYSLEGLILKLKLQYFGHLMWRTDSPEKMLTLIKTEGRRRRGQQRMRWLNGITDLKDMSLSEVSELLKDRKAWCVAVRGVTNSWTQLSDWTELTFQETGFGLSNFLNTNNKRILVARNVFF